MKFALATARDTHQCAYDEDDLIVQALKARGHEARTIIWDETNPAELEGETVVLRTTWDYQAKFQQFMTWLDDLPSAGATLINSRDLIDATIDKAYLIDFAVRGLNVPTTQIIRTQIDLDMAINNPSYRNAILKPCVGAGAIGLMRVVADDPATWQNLDLGETYILQRFLPEIETNGEISFVFFGGSYSHAVRKLPKTGDIRVQSEWGGTVEVITPNDDLIRQATHFLTALASTPTYARIDVVHVAGKLLLMEMEVIEPELFCLQVDGAADRFAQALINQRLSEPKP